MRAPRNWSLWAYSAGIEAVSRAHPRMRQWVAAHARREPARCRGPVVVGPDRRAVRGPMPCGSVVVVVAQVGRYPPTGADVVAGGGEAAQLAGELGGGVQR